MSEPVNPLALDLPALRDWCAAEGVSYAGMEALGRAAQLGTVYRWDAARRGTVVTRAGSDEHFLPHDWLERALDARDAARAAAAAELAAARAAAELAAQAAAVARVVVAPVVVAPVAPPSPAPTPAPAARRAPVRSVPKPAAPKVEQLGLFGGRR